MPGGLFVHFNGFSCRTHHNFARKQNFLAEHIKILPGNLEIRKIGLKLHKFSCRTLLYVLNRLKFVNYIKKSSCRTPPKLPGVKHRENTCLVCAARWLLSLIARFEYDIALAVCQRHFFRRCYDVIITLIYNFLLCLKNSPKLN